MPNVGSLDRVFRLVLGTLLVAAPFTGWPLFASPVAFFASIAVGLVLIATGLIRWCPIYAALGRAGKSRPAARGDRHD